MANSEYFQPALRLGLLEQIERIKQLIPELSDASNPKVIEYCLSFTEQNYSVKSDLELIKNKGILTKKK